METMDLANVKNELTCPVCLDVPRVGHLFQCRNGHLICQEDYQKILLQFETAAGAKCPECMTHYGADPIRNRFAEKMLDLVKMPCR